MSETTISERDRAARNSARCWSVGHHGGGVQLLVLRTAAYPGTTKRPQDVMLSPFPGRCVSRERCGRYPLVQVPCLRSEVEENHSLPNVHFSPHQFKLFVRNNNGVFTLPPPRPWGHLSNFASWCFTLCLMRKLLHRVLDSEKLELVIIFFKKVLK